MRKKISINYTLAIFFFVAASLPSAIIDYLQIGPLINLIKYLGLAYSALIQVYYHFFLRKKWALLHFMLIWMIIASIISGASIYAAIQLLYPLFVACTMSIYMVERDIELTIKTVSIIFSIMVITNLISFFQGGFYQDSFSGVVYFMGIRVNISDILIFAIAISMFGYYLGGRIMKILCILCLASGIAFSLLEWVSTAIVTMSVFGLILLYSFLTRKWPNQKKIIKASAVFLAVVVIILAFNPDFQRFGWLIEDLLGESITMNSRTDIWKSCIRQIEGLHWIYGHGLGHEYIFGLDNGGYVSHPHNQYLAILFNFGFIGLAIYLKMISNQLTAFATISNNKLRAIAGSCIIASIIMGISMTFFGKPYWLIWYIICVSLPTYKLDTSEIITQGELGETDI